MIAYNDGMEIIKSKCDRCYDNALPKELKHTDETQGTLVYPDGKWTVENRDKTKFIPNPIYEKWRQDRERVRDSLPIVWCVRSDDDYMTTICLDCLGLQLKVDK